MSITIYDIAAELEISASTVSRVLNNSPLISNETSKKIHETARKLGYQPRTIKKHKSRAIITIKLVLGPKNDHLLPIFYDFVDLLKGIKLGAENIKLNLATEINDNEFNLFDSKKSSTMDGVIFAFNKPSRAVYEVLTTRKIPNLTLNRKLENEDFIQCDNHIGIHELILAVQKKKPQIHPCYIFLHPHNEISKERLDCLKKICQTLDIPFNDSDIYCLGSVDEINASFLQHLKNKRCNTIIAMNDVVALALYMRALHLGFSIPEDFSLTGFDNSPVRHLMPTKLATISLPVFDLGKKAGEWIQRKIIQKDESPFQVCLPGTIHLGDTI